MKALTIVLAVISILALLSVCAQAQGLTEKFPELKLQEQLGLIKNPESGPDIIKSIFGKTWKGAFAGVRGGGKGRLVYLIPLNWDGKSIKLLVVFDAFSGKPEAKQMIEGTIEEAGTDNIRFKTQILDTFPESEKAQGRLPDSYIVIIRNGGKLITLRTVGVEAELTS